MRKQGDGLEGAKALGGGGESRSRSSQGREHSSREGVLASPKCSSLTRRLWRRCLAVSQGRFGRKARSARADRDRGRQKLRRKLGARSKTPRPGGAAREERSIEAPPGPRGTTPTAAIGVTRARGQGRVVTRLKLRVRRQAKLHLGAHRRPLAEGGPARASWCCKAQRGAHLGIRQSVGCSGRSSVAEVREAHLSPIV